MKKGLHPESYRPVVFKDMFFHFNFAVNIPLQFFVR